MGEPPTSTSLRTFDVHARDGVRRAIPLAPARYLLQRSGTRDALWVSLGAVSVLLRPGKQALPAATVRVAGMLLGAVALLAGIAYSLLWPHDPPGDSVLDEPATAVPQAPR